jgi:GntP family gluconate:H+ symporter
LFGSVLPVALPILLIVSGTASALVPGAPPPGWVLALGEQNFAMAAGAVAALVLLATSRRAGNSPSARSLAVGEALKESLPVGGVIILITAAGAAFGEAMKVTGIAKQLALSMPAAGNHLLWVAFALTAVVRVAQGSATVAMITTVGIVQPLLGELELGFHPVYLALAIGCGSKLGPWMNDSGFWMVSKMSGMSETETLRTFSAQLSVMGLVGFVVVAAMARLLPMVP